MDIVTERYVRKPIYVDAVEVTEENFREIARWCQGKIFKSDGSSLAKDEEPNPQACYVHVRVHSPRSPRQARAYIGDWILYTEMGYKVYTPGAFATSFDKLEEPDGKVQAVTPVVGTSGD